jgi:hypothetical protein
MSEDTTNWLSWLALGMSGLSVFVALLARQDSCRSANASEKSAEAAEKSASAAEKSAEEGAKTRKINQFAVLSPQFSNIEHLIKAFNGWEGTNGIKLAASKISVQHLIDACHQDTDFQKALVSLKKGLEIQPIRDAMRNFASENDRISLAQQSPGDLADIMRIFDEKKKEYLGV